MNDQQKRALALLEKITPDTTQARTLRTSDLLCSSAQKPPFDQRPGEWDAGWCKGWAFAVHPAMAAALDIQLMPRKLHGKATLEWTQGSAFDFHEGYTIHDAVEAQHLSMGEALLHLNVSLSIKQATPAEPATRDTLRKPGSVTYQVYRPDVSRSKLEPGPIHTVTQDAFVKILIQGLTKD